ARLRAKLGNGSVSPRPLYALAADVAPPRTVGVRRAQPRDVHRPPTGLEYPPGRARAPERPQPGRGGTRAGRAAAGGWRPRRPPATDPGLASRPLPSANAG